MKVEEICQDKDIRRKWTKSEISGAADTAWTLKKTVLLEVEVQYVQHLSKDKKIKQKVATIPKNHQEMLAQHKRLLEMDEELQNAKKQKIEGTIIKEKENLMASVMRKLKNSQEALRKSLQERLHQIGEQKSKINEDFEEMPLSIELQDYLQSVEEDEPPAKRKKKTKLVQIL